MLKREDLKPGMVVTFEYQLINHPKTWCFYHGIVLKNEKSLYVWCLRNEHNGVFSAKGGLRKIREVPWRLV